MTVGVWVCVLCSVCVSQSFLCDVCTWYCWDLISADLAAISLSAIAIFDSLWRLVMFVVFVFQYFRCLMKGLIASFIWCTVISVCLINTPMVTELCKRCNWYLLVYHGPNIIQGMLFNLFVYCCTNHGWVVQKHALSGKKLQNTKRLFSWWIFKCCWPLYSYVFRILLQEIFCLGAFVCSNPWLTFIISYFLVTV